MLILLLQHENIEKNPEPPKEKTISCCHWNGTSLIAQKVSKIRDMHKIEKQDSIVISVFSNENKEKHTIYVSNKCCEEKHVG